MFLEIITLFIALIALVLAIVALVYSFQSPLPDNFSIKKLNNDTVSFSINNQNLLSLNKDRIIIPSINLRNQTHSWIIRNNENGELLFVDENSQKPYSVLFSTNDVDFHGITSISKLARK